MEIIFDSKRHEELFHKLIKKCKRVRADTISVMYLLALVIGTAVSTILLGILKKNKTN